MGFESFRVELRAGKASYSQAKETIRKLPHIKPDQQALSTKGSTFYFVDDGRHIIEIELKDAPLRISCRFTLCHPPSVDSVFLDLIRELMLRLGMEVWICDDVRPEDSHPFALAHYAEFSSAASRYIATRRSEWISSFGTEQLAASMNEVYARIILPRCQPVAAWMERNQERKETTPLP